MSAVGSTARQLATPSPLWGEGRGEVLLWNLQLCTCAPRFYGLPRLRPAANDHRRRSHRRPPALRTLHRPALSGKRSGRPGPPASFHRTRLRPHAATGTHLRNRLPPAKGTSTASAMPSSAPSTSSLWKALTAPVSPVRLN